MFLYKGHVGILYIKTLNERDDGRGEINSVVALFIEKKSSERLFRQVSY
jgi:hypothetical protein